MIHFERHYCKKAEAKTGKYFLIIFLFLISLNLCSSVKAQPAKHSIQYISKVWIADNGDGTYKNPVLNADYSDPDVIRIGNDFYLVSSSFEDVPGLPILHSKDLVNWSIIGHGLKKLVPEKHFSIPHHGEGVWAPSIRYHNGEFYIYYPDPDFGIYLIKSKRAQGPWSDPVLVESGKGLIDPCPLWDTNGNAYMIHAFAGSRAGIKSILVIKKLSEDGTKILDEGKLVYDGHETDPTIEGPKMYKRNGYYYIFTPAGGVSTGWQLVLRSKNIYGPYERKVVMDQGSTKINGPHQGAWITTPAGEDWFMHFQDKGVYGRVVHLQPMKWINDWPVIGSDKDGDGKGEPVLIYKKPDVGKTYPVTMPIESDEFDQIDLGLRWQWMANPKSTWYFLDPAKGMLRLYANKISDSVKNLWEVPNVLLQKFPAEEFKATVKMIFYPNKKTENEKAGLAIMGDSYASLAVKSKGDGNYLMYAICKDAGKGKRETEREILKLNSDTIFLRVAVTGNGKCHFSYSFDGTSFTDINEEFIAEPGRWIGAKVGIFCVGETQTNDSGYAYFDWFRIEKIN
jgi:beta-xylosidase